MSELGETDVRAGYFAAISVDEMATLGLAPDEGFNGWLDAPPLDFAIVDRTGVNVIDVNDTSGGAVLVGLNADDEITGGGGKDTIYGGDDNDTLRGGEELDIVYGNDGTDRLEGGSGFDDMYGGSGGDVLIGGADQDWLSGEDGDDILIGGTGDPASLDLSIRHFEWRDNEIDHLSGGGGHDSIYIYGTDQLTYSQFQAGIQGPLDNIDINDTDFTAYFQFAVEDTFSFFVLTGSMLAAALASSGDDVLGSFTATVDDQELTGEIHLGYRGDAQMIWAQWLDSGFSQLAMVQEV